jgi:Zn-dependent M16 (insulinase) family peptidase
MEEEDRMDNAADPFSTPADAEIRILPPDYALKKIIGEDVDLNQIFSPASIEKAQAVINEHKDSFLEWVRKDIEQLNQSYTAAAANPAASEPEIRKLAKTAFIIKSQAGTFGFGLATQVAKSLDDFCSHDFHPSTEHLTVIHKHIETLDVIFHKNIAGDGGALGQDLSESLFKLVSKYKDK